MDTSSSKSTKTLSKKCAKTDKIAKRQQCPRNPLRDLNFSVATTATNSSCSSSSTSTSTSTATASSSSSIEVPRGCLRFFLSHSSSSSSSNTNTPFSNRPTKVKPFPKPPKSAPNTSKPSKRCVLKKPCLDKEKLKKKPTPCLYQWQSGRKPSSRNAAKSKNSASASKSNGFHDNKQSFGSSLGFCNVNDENSTPLSKLANGSGIAITMDKKAVNIISDDDKLSNTSANAHKTPPIQASVSPEIQNIQCASIAVNTTGTPACYGAGHIVSGVTDKRKCRPRGILTVGETNILDFGSAKAIDSFSSDRNDENVAGECFDLQGSGVSLMPLPLEASMNWLLSPCNEEEDEDQRIENSEDVISPCSNLLIDDGASDLCSNNKSSLIIYRPSDYNNVVTSPSPIKCTPSHEITSAVEARNSRYDLDGEKSPFSMDTLGSGNVIQTPESDSSSGRCVGLSWLKPETSQKHPFVSELDQLNESLHVANLWPEEYESIWNPTGTSFQFNCLTSSPSNAVTDLSKFDKILDDHATWMSTSTLQNISQSQMRISWREGLVSRMFEMDEFDSCRYLSSDEEEDEQLKSCQNPELNFDVGDNCFGRKELESTNIEVNSLQNKINGEEQLPHERASSCAESISTDGGGLAGSADSEWNLCYKNELFKI